MIATVLLVLSLGMNLFFGMAWHIARRALAAVAEDRIATRRLRKANLELLNRIADLDRQLKEHLGDSYETSMMHPRQDEP